MASLTKAEPPYPLSHERRPWLFPLLALVLVAVVVVMLEYLLKYHYHQQQRMMALEQLGLVQARLESAANKLLVLNHSVSVVIALNPHITQTEFSRLGRELLKLPSSVRHFAAARDMVISHVYPLAGNEAALGLNYRQSEAQSEAAIRAWKSGKPVLAGPLKLVQDGSKAFVIRQAVYSVPADNPADSREFWGLTATVINAYKLYREAGLYDTQLDINIAIRGQDTQGARGAVFFGDETLFERDPILLTVPLPEGSWQLAALPKSAAIIPELWLLRSGGLPALALVIWGSLQRRRRIKERLLAEQALRDSEARFRTVVENNDDGILLLDAGDRIDLVNSTFSQISGYQPAELHGLKPDELFPHGELCGVLAQAAHHRQTQRCTTELRLKGGEAVAVEVSAIPVESAGTRYVLGLVRDIRERARTEAELRQAKQAAETANAAKNAFLANMSHELRTPLNAILGYAQILQHEAEIPESFADGMQIIRESGEQLLVLIDDILDLSKLEAGKLALRPTLLNLPLFLQNVANMAHSRALYKDLHFEYEPATDLPEDVRLDDKRLRQILLKLLGNAVKFTDTGSVFLRVTPYGEIPDDHSVWLRFEILDTGVGIPVDKLEKIFQPFEQVGDPAYHTDGTGLGLTIAHRLLALMGATLHVESRPGSGSRFWFDLLTPVLDNTRHESRPALDKVNGYEGERRTLLVVDDNAFNRKVLKVLLLRLGFEVHTANGGKEAVACAPLLQPAAILMDLMMPDMDGYAALACLRDSHIPVIAVSASVAAEERSKATAAGFAGFVCKPVVREELLEALEKCLHLKWSRLHEESLKTTADFFHPSSHLPAECIAELNRLMELGDIQGIIDYAGSLEEKAPAAHGLLAEIRHRAESFDLDTLFGLLRQLRKEGDG